MLARSLCASLQADEALSASLDLFCIGTVADMAPLSGVNRRWLMDGLRRLHRSPLPGLRALMDCAGLQSGPWRARTSRSHRPTHQRRRAAGGIPPWWWSC